MNLICRLFGHDAREKTIDEFLIWLEKNNLSHFIRGDHSCARCKQTLFYYYPSIEFYIGIQELNLKIADSIFYGNPNHNFNKPEKAVE